MEINRDGWIFACFFFILKNICMNSIMKRGFKEKSLHRLQAQPVSMNQIINVKLIKLTMPSWSGKWNKRPVIITHCAFINLVQTAVAIYNTNSSVKFGNGLKLHVIDFKSDRRQMLTLFCWHENHFAMGKRLRFRSQCRIL